MNTVLNSKTVALVVALLIVLAADQTATAGPIFTFGFTDITGVYDGATTWSMTPDSNTTGDVTRDIPATGTASYLPDFTGGTADFALTMQVAMIDATHYSGDGSFIVTDADGDTITGDISGVWTKFATTGIFGGDLTNVWMNELGDGIFEGPSGGSFDMDFSPAPEPYIGGLTVIEIAGWFGSAFTDPDALTTATMIPEPVTLTLVAFSGMMLLRRRR
ncbi:MAG: hypothetical protein ABII12_16370 [Planctomycetota bacterium]